MVVHNHDYQRAAIMILDVYMVEGRRFNETAMSSRIAAIRSALLLLRLVPIERTLLLLHSLSIPH